MTPKLYQPYLSETGLWEFRTAIGLTTNIFTKAEALREAANTERADRKAAASTVSGPLVAAIRKGLAEEVEP